MLYLISSIQMPTYLAYCCTSNNMQYAQVLPPEAEKHTSPYIFYGIPLTAKIPSVNSPCTNANPIAHCPSTYKKLNYCTFQTHVYFCGLM